MQESWLDLKLQKNFGNESLSIFFHLCLTSFFKGSKTFRRKVLPGQVRRLDLNLQEDLENETFDVFDLGGHCFLKRLKNTFR